MDDRLCFVQFLHPGGEHRPNAGTGRRWTQLTEWHARKFLQQPGRIVIDGQIRTDELQFWGEWEADSTVVREILDPLPDGPHWIYRPVIEPPLSFDGLHNTDPFVFGQRFHYTGCLQHTQIGPTRMRHLARGSVILFGSCLHRSFFVVDTVFVVDSHIDHDRHTYRDVLAGQISESYATVTIGPWYADPLQHERVFRLYFGATVDNPVDGMFSFFPCLPTTGDSRGFARPVIHLPGLITPTQSQNRKQTYLASTAEMKLLWERVVQQVTAQGLHLGVSAALPSVIPVSAESG